MGTAGEWLRAERRRTLGDWVAVCAGCGHAQRYFDENEAEVAAACPACGGRIVSRCADCGARFSSAFAVTCEGCGSALRPDELFGVPIRRAEPGGRLSPGSRRSGSP